MNKARYATACILTIALAACSKSRHAEQVPVRQDGEIAEKSPVPVPTPGEPPRPIGSAQMKPDGTIILQLRAEDGSGRRGDAVLTYPASHPRYHYILDHLGGIKPGEDKEVPPWPE